MPEWERQRIKRNRISCVFLYVGFVGFLFLTWQNLGRISMAWKDSMKKSSCGTRDARMKTGAQSRTIWWWCHRWILYSIRSHRWGERRMRAIYYYRRGNTSKYRVSHGESQPLVFSSKKKSVGSIRLRPLRRATQKEMKLFFLWVKISSSMDRFRFIRGDE